MKSDKLRRIYALVFLLSYLSFMGVSLFHFHPFVLSSRQSETVSAQNSAVKTILTDSDDCPICHLYFSLTICPVPVSDTNIIAKDARFFVFQESLYYTLVSGAQSQRGPPFNNPYSV